MAGDLYSADHPGYLKGTTGAIEDRQAATKLYVDNSPMRRNRRSLCY